MLLGDSNADGMTDAFVFSTQNSTTGVNTGFAVVESNATTMQYNHWLDIDVYQLRSDANCRHEQRFTRRCCYLFNRECNDVHSLFQFDHNDV